MNNYPEFYKKLVVNKYNNRNNTINQLLDTYDISNGSLYNWVNKTKHNQPLIKKKYIKQSKYTAEIKCYIRFYVIRNKNFDYRKLIIIIKKKYNVSASKTSIYRILGFMKITRKRVRRRLIYKRKTITMARKKFKKTIKPIKVDDIISIDETSIDNQLYPLYAWSKKGKRILVHRNAVKERYTIITAISKDKVVHYDIIKGSANAIHFKNFIQTLENKGIQNKHLLVDNARIHIQYLYLAKKWIFCHAKIIKEYMCTSSNKFLYNVAYTPEFNPIEHLFSKIKNLLRKRVFSNKSKLFKDIHLAFKNITSVELRNYYKYSLNK